MTKLSVLNYIEEKLDVKAQRLTFRFPTLVLDNLLHSYYKQYDHSAFLIGAGSTVKKTALKKIANSYLLSLPCQNGVSEQIYIGLSDYLSFIIVFEESEKEIRSGESKFLLSFDINLIKPVFNYFFESYCSDLNETQRNLVQKLKGVNMEKLDPYYVAKFQESLLVDSLNINNKMKKDRIVEALSFTDESIAITDLSGVIKDVNENFRTSFKGGVDKVSQILPEDTVRSALDETLQNNSWQYETKIKSSNNKNNVYLISCNLYKDDLGRPAGYVFSFKDVTNLRKLNSINKKLIKKLREKNVELVESNKRLVEAQKIRNELLSVVSHELKTPVSTIIGFSELLSNNDFDQNMTKEYSKQINASGKKLNKLLTDYLDIATNQFGVSGDHMKSSRINLVDLVNHVYEDAISKYDKNKYSLEINTIGYKPVLFSELSNLYKLFYNIVDNSLKYMPEGGKIVVKFLNDNDKVNVSIADEGVGISVEDSKKVFEPFFRNDNSITREFDGMGLGLAVCKKIVDIYNGSIWCEPNVDNGTVFYVTLPVSVNKGFDNIEKQSQTVNANVI